ncbi:hypothetical protein [Sulfuracidifex tepidarius]|uniref:Uncharacterized protein n=1 Tax=Sulfuracidifex tepidarius TaxID=1294262 RepID=A0A510E4L3_9CREN|nr:hypothetical protein [Sulfuracidifex tepidarius]BBG27465.1 hypothetical protein IC007_2019 [Sulfuracidifex tepidarius]
MSLLSILSQFPELRSSVDFAVEISKELDLELVVSPYLDERIMENIIKEMEYKYADLFRQYKYSKDKFVEKVLEKDGRKTYEQNMLRFPYYGIPFSGTTKVRITEKGAIPSRAVMREGTFRLSFLNYDSYSTLEKRVQEKEEDDIKVTFQDEKIINFDRKRSIFIEPNLVTKLLSSKENVEATLWISPKTVLMLPMIGMNVYSDNSLVITRENDDIRFKIEKGKATRDDVISGNTVSLEEKARIYYDFKAKKNLQKENIINGLIAKLP